MRLSLLPLLIASTVPVAAQDTLPVFDTPATAALVDRVVLAGSTIPAELQDYRADIHSGVYLSIRPDSALGGEIPVSVDEFAGEVRWSRNGALEQALYGHRVRLLVPAPYTLGSALREPWVIPHLYGSTIDVFDLSSDGDARERSRTRALQPFSERGRPYYSFAVRDTLRITTGGGDPLSLVTIEVTPRRRAPPGLRLVVGSFSIDTLRAAVARARFGFTARGGFTLSRTGVFFDLENGLVDGRFWLPYRQRREVQVSSPLFGGAAAARLVTRFRDVELNTGWSPPPAGTERLVREPIGRTAFAGLGPLEVDADMADFADLARAAEGGGGDGVRLSLSYERGDHLFRYNRVEGTYLGLGASLQPRDASVPWEVYATGGWAFAEGTPRGEVQLRRLATRPGRVAARIAAYRRLVPLQAFRPAFGWDWIYAFPAALGGYDVRDYLDGSGIEVSLARRRGSWTVRGVLRSERQDSLQRNTDSYLFGEADDFPPVAPIDPGTHAALETEVAYARGAGASSLGNGLVASLRGEVGFADFDLGRLTGLLSARREVGVVTIAGRVDGAHLVGSTAPQWLLRFGEAEGLRGYAPNQFGGTTAAIGRARLLVHLPPYGEQPLARSGLLLIPPLRPALTFSSDAGWSTARDDARADLLRIGAVPTGGTRTSLGVGVSIFGDALSAEYVWPGRGGGDPRLYVGFARRF
jgi:hypothetical protein